MDYLADLMGVIARALGLSPNAMAGIDSGYGPWAIPLGIIFLAAVSTTAGEVIVLSLNHVRGFRLTITLAFAFTGHLLTYLALAGSLWIGGALLLGTRLNVVLLLQAVTVSAAPHLFGFLVMLPYTGPGIERILQFWSFVILWRIVAYEFSTGPWFALFITALGALGMVMAFRTLGPPLARARDRIWRLFTNRPLLLSAAEIRGAFPLPDGATSPRGDAQC